MPEYQILPNGQRILVNGGQYDWGELDCQTVADFDWDHIPKRPWLGGERHLRGYVTILTGFGGVGKTALSLTTSLGYALGRNLLDPTNQNPHWMLHTGPLRTYVYSLEDDKDEFQRRLAAVMNYHSIEPRQLEDRLFFGDGAVNHLIIAITDKGGKKLRSPLIEDLIAILIERKIDVLILDPFVKLHGCNENDNGEMDFVMVLLKEIATRANVAIWVIHHSGKTGTSFDPHGGRGASSIIAAGRISEILIPATKDEREQFDLEGTVVKLEATKANMSALGEVQYLRLSGHPVGNGDYAQVIELIEIKTPMERMDEVLFDNICAAIRKPPTDPPGVWVSKRGQPTWVGNALTQAGIRTDDNAACIVVGLMKRSIIIPVEDAKDARGRPLRTAVALNEVMAEQFRAQSWSATTTFPL